jgi:hypothetical protein
VAAIAPGPNTTFSVAPDAPVPKPISVTPECGNNFLHVRRCYLHYKLLGDHIFVGGFQRRIQLV